MAKNLTSFDTGNRRALRLTDEIAELFIDTIRQTGRVSVAAGRCCVGTSTVRGWLRKGREENADPLYKEFADDVERARAEFLAVAARRMSQLAIGGVLTLPKYNKLNQLVRDAEGEIEWEERYFPPNVNALAHVLDRIDPQPNGDAPQPGVPIEKELTDAEQLADAARHYDLFAETFRVMVEAGYPVQRLIEQAAIETTATKTEPEPAKEDVAASDVLKPEPSTEPGAKGRDQPFLMVTKT